MRGRADHGRNLCRARIDDHSSSLSGPTLAEVGRRSSLSSASNYRVARDETRSSCSHWAASSGTSSTWIFAIRKQPRGALRAVRPHLAGAATRIRVGGGGVVALQWRSSNGPLVVLGARRRRGTLGDWLGGPGPVHEIKSPKDQYVGLKFGRSERIRTSDPIVPNDVRYQAALHSDIATDLGAGEPVL